MVSPRHRIRPLAERFWEKVEIGPDCWVWGGGKAVSGYGVIFIGGTERRTAHRVSWELEHGPIPEGMWVLHRCDNPPCVRPSHLFLGTQVDNMRDASRKGRMHPGEANGQARLTADAVRDIRARVSVGGWGTMAALAREYNVSPATVRSAVRRETWQGVA